MRWGLVPHWSKHEDRQLKTFNARAEAFDEPRGIWARLKARRRCVVPVQGSVPPSLPLPFPVYLSLS